MNSRILLCILGILSAIPLCSEAKVNPDGTFTISRADMEQCVQSMKNEETWKAAYEAIDPAYRDTLAELEKKSKEVKVWQGVSLGVGVGGVALSLVSFFAALVFATTFLAK